MKSDAGNSGIKTLVDSGDDDDDDDESDDEAAPVQAFTATDRGATISGGKAKPAMSNAEKKLASLGLSSEVDAEEPPKANKPQAAEAAAAAKGPAKDKEREDSDDDGAAGAPAVQLGSNIKEFVMTTIPKSQQQPVQCYIKRVRTGLQKLWPYYVLYSQDPDKFLLSGRRRKKNKQSTYLISTDEKDLSRKSDNYTGKVKSNFVGTMFTMYDSGGNPTRLQDGQEVRTELGIVQYDRNVLGTNGPRKMQVFLPPTDKRGQREVMQPTRIEDCMASRAGKDNTFIKLMNKTPRWNESLGAFCLNFQGRVTVASVKNFQLVDERDQDRIVLQFGKCDDDTFTMDYSYPLCALQAFAICLTSFDHKLACE